MQLTAQSIRTLLQEHIPEQAVDYCTSLWDQYRFDFVISRKRVTKIGDFCSVTGRTPKITVNRDLNPFLFLTTYIHEVAHLTVHLNHGRKAEAHGTEWKTEFRRLMEPVLNPANYPEELFSALSRHMEDPMATTYSDSNLMRLFRVHDGDARPVTLLSDIPAGSIFELRGRWFRKEETKRTRTLCQEVKTKRRYLVPADAPVNNIQLSLL